MPDAPAPASADAPVDLPLDITKTAVGVQLRAQLRIAIAALAGAAVGRHILPDGLIDDRLLDLLTGAAMLAVAAGWQWARVRLGNSRWWKLATDPRVPDDLVRVASSSK